MYLRKGRAAQVKTFAKAELQLDLPKEAGESGESGESGEGLLILG